MASDFKENLRDLKDAMEGVSKGGIEWAGSLKALLNPMAAAGAAAGFLAQVIGTSLVNAFKAGWNWAEASRASYSALGASMSQAREKAASFARELAEVAKQGSTATAMMDNQVASSEAQLNLELAVIEAIKGRTKAYIDLQVATGEISKAEGVRLQLASDIEGAEAAANAQIEANNRALAARSEAIFKARNEVEQLQKTVASLAERKGSQADPKMREEQVKAAEKALDDAIAAEEKFKADEEAAASSVLPWKKTFFVGIDQRRADIQSAVETARADLNFQRGRKVEDLGPALDDARKRLIAAQGRLGGLSQGGDNLTLENQAIAASLAGRRDAGRMSAEAALIRDQTAATDRAEQLQRQLADAYRKSLKSRQNVDAELLQNIEDNDRRLREIEDTLRRLRSNTGPNTRK